jgi:ribosomal protein S18 acetylase RimI-like enzyme
MATTIRPFQPADLPRLREITVEAFNGVSIDQNAERHLGLINGHDWQWRKARHVDDDVRRDPQGTFVAADGEKILGYISTWMDAEAGIGFIPNLALTANARGQGLGHRLLEHALEHFRRHGLAVAKIETLDQNPVGQHLYPAIGFREVARQVHYFMPLAEADRG